MRESEEKVPLMQKCFQLCTNVDWIYFKSDVHGKDFQNVTSAEKARERVLMRKCLQRYTKMEVVDFKRVIRAKKEDYTSHPNNMQLKTIRGG